jgi:hypothetical protein
MNKQTFNRMVIGFLSGLQLCTLVFVLKKPSQKNFGVVDAHALVSIEAQKVMAEDPKNQLPPEKLHEIAMHLKKRVEHFASTHTIILLAKGAVWGGELPDYTDSVMTWLQAEDDAYAD